MIGQWVGNYQITKLLGEGGMGVVYLAEHPGIGRKVAVKVLHPELTKNEEIARRFFNEARAANAIGHPGIVEVLDFGTLASGTYCITMEFLDGENLAARIRRQGRLRIADALEFGYQAASALDAAHAKGIIHRDLKPDNLYLVPDNRTPGHEIVKVLDFGIAKLGGGAVGGRAEAGSVKTRTGTVMGTPVYMSPEQCRGTKEVDHRADVYALGVILYEMVCGDPPFMSDGQGELIHLHISATPPSPRARIPEIPQELEDVILRALGKDPADRFQTMGEFQQALKGSPAPRVAGTLIYPRGLADGAAPLAPRTTLSGSVSVLERQLAKPRRLRVAALLGGAMLAASVAVFVASKREHPESAHSNVPVSRAVVAAPPASPSLATAPKVGPVMVVVNVASEPSGARIVRERDGAIVGLTPFKESWAPAVGIEKLRLELDGYKTESVAVPLDRGVDLAFSLKRNPVPASRKRVAGVLPSAPSVPPTPSHESRPTPAPSSAPVAPPGPVPKAEPIPL